MDPRRDVIIAQTGSGTLFAAVPKKGGRYRIRRCRTSGRPGAREATFEGVLVSVREPQLPAAETANMVRCGALMFELVPGTFGRPAKGERMAVGGDSRGVQEVSSRVAWVGIMDIDRAWTITPMLRAFRNGARDWRSFMTEKAYEHGDEHIEDTTGSLSANVLERHYQSYLMELARERDGHMSHLGHEVLPFHDVASNEDVSRHGRKLAAELAGEGMQLMGTPVPRKHRNAIAASLERCWGAVRRMDGASEPIGKAA